MDRRGFLQVSMAAGGAALVGGCAARRETAVEVISTRDPTAEEVRPVGGGRREGDIPDARAGGGVARAPSRGDAPLVMPRGAWTRAGPRTWLADPMGSVTRITVHHDGMPPVELRTEREVIDRIEAIRRAHLRLGWADIGYHYVIDPMGRVWQARPRTLQGAHVKYNNEHNLGVMVLGNFMVQRPTAEALASLDQFVASNMRFFGVPLGRVHTHRELRPTACPGTHLQSHMVSARGVSGALARLA